MLCALLITLALVACALAESSLRQAAPAVTTKAHENFLKDFQRRSKLASTLALDDVEVEAVTVANAYPNPPVETRFTGVAYQQQTKSFDCATPPLGPMVQEASFKLGVCHPHYMPRRGQPKSSLFYLQYDMNGFTIVGQYYSNQNCGPDSFLYEGPFYGGPSCDHGAKAMWGSRAEPGYSGLVTTMSFGSACPQGPWEPKYAVFSNTSTPLNLCQDEDSGGSHLMTGCNIDPATGNIFVNGYSFDAHGCTGSATPIVNMDFGPACQKAGRNAFQVTSCIVPPPAPAPAPAP